MLDAIMQAAGIQYRAGRFMGTKPDTYAVTMDDITTDGPDAGPMIYQHDVTIELYEDRPDPAAEAALEAAITAHGLQWTKQARYWIQSEHQYQAIYSLTYYEKRRP